MRIAHAMRKMLDALYAGAAILAAICLALIAVLVLAQVVGRWFGIIVPAAEDVAGFLMAATTFLALAWTLRSDGHIRVTLLIRHLSPRLRRAQEILVLAVATALVAIIAWSSLLLVFESFEYQDVSGGYFAVPLWIPQMPMAAGLVLLAIALLDELANVSLGHSATYEQER